MKDTELKLQPNIKDDTTLDGDVEDETSSEMYDNIFSLSEWYDPTNIDYVSTDEYVHSRLRGFDF